MATSKFFIVHNPTGISTGIIQLRTKENIGLAWKKEAPDGYYIDCSLDDYVIISKEEYNKLKK